jgi:hypothetical protein
MVMDLYSREFKALGVTPAPPGTELPSGYPGAELWGVLAQQLGLQRMGVYTPWAGRAGGIEWEMVAQPPNTNVVAFPINDAILQTITSLTFGHALPFVAIVTDRLATPAEAEAAFNGSPYRFYETQAVYRQDDPGNPPKISFMHWGEYRRPEDPQHGKGSTEDVAKRIGSTLVYGIQANYDDTATRSPPDAGFIDALQQQLSPMESPLPPAEPPPPGEEPPPGDPPPPGEPDKASMFTPILLGLGLAVGTFVVVRHVRK